MSVPPHSPVTQCDVSLHPHNPVPTLHTEASVQHTEPSPTLRFARAWCLGSSMPPRSKDPLNFDDIFIAAGAEGLVKKTMGEMRKPRTSPAGSSTPQTQSAGGTGMAPGFTSIPAASHAASKTNGHAVNLPAGAFDFLEGLSSAPASQNPVPAKQQPTSTFEDPFSTFSAPAAPLPPKPAAAHKPHDPFAMFDDVPGAAVPPPPAVHDPLDFADFHDATRPSAGGGQGFHGFEDVAPVFPDPTPEVITTTAVEFHDYPPALVASSPAPAPAPTSAPTPATASPVTVARDPSLSANPLLSSTSSAAVASGRVPKPSLGGSSDGTDPRGSMHRTGSTGQVTATREGSRVGLNNSVETSDADAYTSSSLYTKDISSSGDGHAGWGGSRKHSKAPPAATGMMGMLKGLGHKAVKAAQAGLQQLESALERLDQPQQGGAGGAGPHQAGHEPMVDRLPDSSSYYSPSRHDEPAGRERQGQHDDPGILAADLLALPPAERYQALASIPMPMRAKVQRALDQLTEGEEQPAIHTTPVAFDDRSSAGYGTPGSKPGSQATSAVRQEHGFEDSPPQFTSPTASKPPLPSPGLTAAQPSPPPPAPAAAAAAAVHHHSDFLGIDSPKAPTRTATAPSLHVEEDLLGVGSFAAATTTSNSGAASTAPAQPPSRQTSTQPAAAAVGDIDDMHDFFSGGAAPAPAAGVPASGGAAGRSSSGSRVAPPARRSAPDMMDLGAVLGDGAGLDVDVGAHGHLYATEQGEDGEPELRRQLRAAREAEKHRKMKEALANKLAVEAEEARQRAEQVELKDQYKVAIESWKNKNKGNIRGLLGSLQTVLWEGSGWQPVSVADVLDPPQIRKVWMRANLLVHPDKVKQKAGSPEQVARADLIFDVLKDAWNVFTTSGR